MNQYNIIRIQLDYDIDSMFTVNDRLYLSYFSTDCSSLYEFCFDDHKLKYRDCIGFRTTYYPVTIHNEKYIVKQYDTMSGYQMELLDLDGKHYKDLPDGEGFYYFPTKDRHIIKLLDGIYLYDCDTDTFEDKVNIDMYRSMTTTDGRVFSTIEVSEYTSDCTEQRLSVEDYNVISSTIHIIDNMEVPLWLTYDCIIGYNNNEVFKFCDNDVRLRDIISVNYKGFHRLLGYSCNKVYEYIDNKFNMIANLIKDNRITDICCTNQGIIILCLKSKSVYLLSDSYKSAKAATKRN